MLETFLASLTKRQSMLLLTAVTFGGQESLASLDHLPEAEAALLKHRAEELLALPKERRIPLLVQEMKRLVTPRRGQLWATSPEQLAQLLLRERVVTRQVLLKALPSGLADSVRRCLPPDRTQPGREVRAEVLNILRGKLEEILVRATPEGAAFKFADVLLLQPRELLTLLDGLGTRALGPSLAGIATEDSTKFIEELPPGLRETADEHMLAARVRRLNPEDSASVLALHAGTGSVGSIRSAGAQRLARALLAQSTEFAGRVLERHPGRVGDLVNRWVREERHRAVNRGDGGRLDVVAELERLAQRGLVERPLRPAQPLAPPARENVPQGASQRLPLLPAPRAQAALRMAHRALDARREPARPPPEELAKTAVPRKPAKPPLQPLPGKKGPRGSGGRSE